MTSSMSIGFRATVLSSTVSLLKYFRIKIPSSKAKKQYRKGDKCTVHYIVGKGLHSETGRSRLGPAVTAKLSGEGVSYVSREGVVKASL